MERTQFTFYRSIRESARLIRSKAARCDFYDAICDYALDGKEPKIDQLSDAGAVGFVSAKPNLDASRKKAQSGKKGGESKQTGSKPEANPSKPKQAASEKENEIEKEKEVEKENEIEDENDCSTALAYSPDFLAFWNAYPKQIGQDTTWDAWQQLLSKSPVSSETILEALHAWKQSSQWQEDGGRFIPHPARFLFDGYWRTPPKIEKKTPCGARGELGQAELEAIQRVLREG